MISWLRSDNYKARWHSMVKAMQQGEQRRIDKQCRADRLNMQHVDSHMSSREVPAGSIKTASMTVYRRQSLSAAAGQWLRSQLEQLQNSEYQNRQNMKISMNYHKGNR